MNKKNLIAGSVSIIIALIFTLVRFTKVAMTFNESFLPNIYIYPAAFFAFLGLMLIFLGLKPLWRS
jgi:hypothetical protein